MNHVLRNFLQKCVTLSANSKHLLIPSFACTVKSWPRVSCLHTSKLLHHKKTVTINFIMSDGTKTTVEAKQGDNLLDVVLDHDVDIDGYGACEGTLACSTCHLILEQETYDSLEPPCDEELDMLDLAYGLQDTSRLGCQIVLTKELDGITVKVPEGLSDARG